MYFSQTEKLWLLLMLGLSFASAWAVDFSSQFDKPLFVKQKPLPSDPLNPNSKPQLSCFYFPDFMIKQVDLGEIGAERLSIVKNVNKPNGPSCAQDIDRNEIVIEPKVWDGYFKGVKGEYVLFEAADGLNGGVPFAVFNSKDGTKIFEDVAADFLSIELMTSSEKSSQSNQRDIPIRLRYERVYVAPCSLYNNNKECWSDILKVTGLPAGSPPDCAAAYSAEKMRTPKFALELEGSPSVIKYGVEVVLDRSPSVIRITPISSALSCYLPD